MLTNKLNLPEPIWRASNAAMYSKGDSRYSVTELLLPPRIGALRRYYADVIVEDCADHIASLEGKMWHLLFEKAGAPDTGAILEERLYWEFDGVKISGAMDHTILRDGMLDDYKTCSVYAVRAHLREPKWEWVWQLNLYRLLRAKHGQAIDKLRIIARMRDWMLPQALAAIDSGGDYPPHETMPLDVPVLPLDEVEEFVRIRIKLHLDADAQVEQYGPEAASLPLCTDEERWRSPVEWAHMRPNRKSAVKVYRGPTAQQDAEYALAHEPDAYLEQRGGVYRRCKFYCPIGRAGLCTQWNADKDTQPAEAVDTSAFE